MDMRYPALVALTLGLVMVATARSAEWNQFRGPGGLAHAEDKLPTEWSTDKNVQWKVPLPGTGWSSPVVWGDKVFVTTAATENQRKPQAMNFGGGGFGPDGGKGKGGLPGGKGKGGFPGGGYGGRNQPPDKVYRW